MAKESKSLMSRKMVTFILSLLALVLVVSTTMGYNLAKSPFNVFNIGMSTMTMLVIVALVLVQVAPAEMLGNVGIEEGFTSPIDHVNGVAVGVDGVDLVAKMGGRFRADGPHELVGMAGEMPSHFPAAGGDPAPGRMVAESSEKMFYFNKNQARPECCGST